MMIQRILILKLGMFFLLIPLLFTFSSYAQQPVSTRVPATSASPQKPDRSESGQPIIIYTDLVTINVSVTDRQGHSVTGLNKDDFILFDTKTPQQITFLDDIDLPASIGIVFDTSGSMTEEKINLAKESLSSFFENSREDDDYFLIGVSSRPQLLINTTQDYRAVLNKINRVKVGGDTALNDAVYLGLEKVSRGNKRKKAIILISDGQENNSRYSFTQLKHAVEEQDVIIYSIGIEGWRVGRAYHTGQIHLRELAEVSGGEAFFPDQDTDLHHIFERIALALRHQYLIGYKPSSLISDGKFHHVTVKLAHREKMPGLIVRSKKGYYAYRQASH